MQLEIKSNKKRILIMISAFIVLLILATIGWISVQSANSNEKRFISPLDPAWIYTNGKWEKIEQSDWGEVMSSKQTGARALIETNSPYAILKKRGNGNDVTVFVDGVIAVTYPMPNDGQIHEIPIFSDSKGWHRIEVGASWINENDGLYISKKAEVRTPEDQRKRLVVVGHSYAEGCCIKDKGIKSFAPLLGNMLGVESINEGVGRTDVNVGGNRSALGLVQKVIDWKPDYVLAVYGYNARSPIGRGTITHEDYQADYTEFIKRITDALPQTHVFVSGIPSLRGLSEKSLDPFNQDIKTACSNVQNCTYIDLKGKWNDSNYDKYVSNDGVHPSEEGFQFLAEEYAKVISTVMKK